MSRTWRRAVGPALVVALATGCASSTEPASQTPKPSPTTPAGSTTVPVAAPMVESRHLVPEPLPPDAQLVGELQNAPLDPAVISTHRYAQLYRGPAGALLYVDAEPAQRSNWTNPSLGSNDRLVHLRAGPGILTAHEPNADQVLFNRIGGVFDDRVPTPRVGGAVLLWTDGILDYYGVALNVINSDQLLLRVAANIRPASGTKFTLPTPAQPFTLRFSGDPLEQWRSSQPAVGYGFASEAFGEIDITLTPAKPGFAEALLGAGTVPIQSAHGWLLTSQSSLNMTPSYTLFWYEAPGEMAILTSDGRITDSALLAFADILRPVDQASWASLVNRISSA